MYLMQAVVAPDNAKFADNKTYTFGVMYLHVNMLYALEICLLIHICMARTSS